MARTPSIDIRGELSSLVPVALLRELAEETGAVKRQRKVRIVDLFWTPVLGFGSGKEKTFAGLRRALRSGSSTTDCAFGLLGPVSWSSDFRDGSSLRQRPG